jgi:squalene-hopene/tetraprenyl-beta-curcumene cyclase
MRSKIGLLSVLVSFAVASVISPAAWGAEPAVKLDSQLHRQTVERGVQYLLTHGQAPDGSFSANSGPAITAICTAALLKSGKSPDDPAVAKSLKYLERFVQPDGGIYGPSSQVQNYETSIAVMCFAEANKDGRYKKLIEGADRYLKNLQWGGATAVDPSNVNYGGAGYGKKNRPDLSNTSFLLDALQAAGNSGDDEAVQRALIFVSRCQNLESEHNTTPYASKNPDGGFYYTVAAGGESQAGKTEDGGLRSYGSMTYAGLKSMIYAGVGPDDPRVKAAVGWLRKNYDLESNPGMGNSGLYYYYHTFAKALSALGQDTFDDEQGVAHNWRAELVAELASRQRADGSWVNIDRRWLESDPNLVTAYALLALSYCEPTSK